MDPNSGRVISNEQYERLQTLDAAEAAKFTERVESLEHAKTLHASPVEVEYTETEQNDLAALRTMRNVQKVLARSGNPAKKAKAQATLRGIELEVAKIHKAAETRARLGVTL